MQITLQMFGSEQVLVHSREAFSMADFQPGRFELTYWRCHDPYQLTKVRLIKWQNNIKVNYMLLWSRFSADTFSVFLDLSLFFKTLSRVCFYFHKFAPLLLEPVET